ncbi:MAG: hypothetical protein DRQ78_06380 [Epsilonproteobacteria bacterium]|nr:MAG: hypothetical protein DRQ78_06380 [Campylobacterota bacterium]
MIEKLDSILDEDSLSNEDFLVFIANQLISFGRKGLVNDTELSQINTNDSVEVGLVLNAYPNNPFVASILQGHAILKWSEFFKE